MALILIADDAGTGRSQNDDLFIQKIGGQFLSMGEVALAHELFTELGTGGKIAAQQR